MGKRNKTPLLLVATGNTIGIWMNARVVAFYLDGRALALLARGFSIFVRCGAGSSHLLSVCACVHECVCVCAHVYVHAYVCMRMYS